MNKKQLLETAGIKVDNWDDNLIPFKPRPRFGSGHFAFVVMLMFTFFSFSGTVYAATTVTISQSLQPLTKSKNKPSDQMMTPLTKAIDELRKQIKKDLNQLKKTVEQIENNNTVSVSRATLFAAVIAACASIWVAVRNSKTQEKITKLENKLTGDMLRDARLEEHVFNSLQWLSGGTQKRSIGIAVINANWENKKLSHLRETWISVLVAQAVYLLAEQDRKEGKQRQHEITNANNILRILEKTVKETELLDDRHIEELQRALKTRKKEEEATKVNSKHGLELPEGAEARWEKLVYDAKAKKKPQCWLRLFIS